MEAFHNMNVGYPIPYTQCMAMKLDMIKVYDRVEWDFLEGILIQMSFPHW